MKKSYINQVKQPPYPFITVVRLKQNMIWDLNLWAEKVKKKKIHVKRKCKTPKK